MRAPPHRLFDRAIPHFPALARLSRSRTSALARFLKLCAEDGEGPSGARAPGSDRHAGVT